MSHPILVPVSTAELFDKKTILEIKRQRVVDSAQLANIEREWALLVSIAGEVLAATADRPAVEALEAKLFAINSRLWDLENTVRACERAGCFDSAFVQAARGIYAGNDERAAVKRRINALLGSLLIEEKSHT